MGLGNWGPGKEVAVTDNHFLMPSQVFSRSIVDGINRMRQGHQVAFLDEFRIIMTSYNDFPIGLELLVCNTHVPQDHPRNLRPFRFPSKYRNRNACLYLHHDRSIGTANKDGPLLIDPTQAIFIIELPLSPPRPGVLLALRVQPLIELACLMHTDAVIPWDQWGRDSVAMEIPMTLFSRIHTSAIHGARLLVTRGIGHEDERRSLHVFDFSRKGSAALPFSAGGDRIQRRALFEHGRSCTFKGAGRIEPQGPQSIGDSLVFHIVRLLSLIPLLKAL